jgi:hypothetical protein
VSVSHITESGLILLFGHPCVSGLVVEVDYSCIQTFFLFLLLFFTMLVEVYVYFGSYSMSRD